MVCRFPRDTALHQFTLLLRKEPSEWAGNLSLSFSDYQKDSYYLKLKYYWFTNLSVLLVYSALFNFFFYRVICVHKKASKQKTCLPWSSHTQGFFCQFCHAVFVLHQHTHFSIPDFQFQPQLYHICQLKGY